MYDLFFCHTTVQAFIVPLQGFMNAIVYGWTREDFVQLMAIGNKEYDGWYVQNVSGPEENDSQPMHSSLSKSEITSVTDKYGTSFSESD